MTRNLLDEGIDPDAIPESDCLECGRPAHGHSLCITCDPPVDAMRVCMTCGARHARWDGPLCSHDTFADVPF
jgi:hypothetical protein